jgi:hypothetical protein
MKKSEITVTMPINTYDELIVIKTKYETLIKQFINCYDTNNFKINPAELVRFDGVKAESIMHEFLPYSCRDAKISF